MFFMDISLFIPLGIILLGGFLAFFGYRHLKKVLVLVAFLGGIVGSFALINLLVLEKSIWVYVGSFTVGVVLAIGTFIFFEIGIFLLGSVLGGILVFFVSRANENFVLDVNALVFFLVAIVVGGILAILFRKHILIFSTSLIGTMTMLVGISFLAVENFDSELLSKIENYFDNNQVSSFIIFTFVLVFSLLLQYKIIKFPKARGDSHYSQNDEYGNTSYQNNISYKPTVKQETSSVYPTNNSQKENQSVVTAPPNKKA